jgi:hypothetical protein
MRPRDVGPLRGSDDHEFARDYEEEPGSTDMANDPNDATAKKNMELMQTSWRRT